MLMINKWVSSFSLIGLNRQVIEIKWVGRSSWNGRGKKGNSILEVCLQKLLKTHVEIMSDFSLVQKLLKRKVVKDFLKVCY